jgi:hypothetical protein
MLSYSKTETIQMSDKIMLNFRCPSSVLEAIDNRAEYSVIRLIQNTGALEARL